METPRIILELIDRFGAHRDIYASPQYNETQVRREFIDPFFEALGWDVQNKKGFAEPYKEVVHEDAIKIGGATKAPDYSFRLGGRRHFFLEAKKPAIHIKDDPAPAFQLRRYAWTAKLPLSILTDFEDFIVYDGRVKPAATDKASAARILCIHFKEYADRWQEIAGLFSPEAIQKGALDKYVESTGKKRGTAEVDDAFLAEIEEWRDFFARNIALRNEGLTQRELNFAVQVTIDRIIFLRICEDRAIENYGQLQALLNGDDTYARLRVLFERADERYNSGLFHFHKEKERPAAPDIITPKILIDDKTLKTVIRRLYYPDGPYEFSVFPAEILGQVYERFLGSVIRLTPAGQAKVEQKPEVRKAGGVYYTPAYIVEYIVKHTVGKLLEGKTPQEVAGLTDTWRPSKTSRPIAILDPACGSGSFLVAAYQCLLDWHLGYYTRDAAKWAAGKSPRIYQNHRAGWRLSTAERKRILVASIYGVDIDPQAVEVTKLSLLLKVLDGQDAEAINRQLDLLHERALPDLASNIKCGNSLIGPDFYDGKQTEFDEEETYRVNAFDWRTEFPIIMKSGGFDAVIGNPPYLFITEVPQEMRSYYQRKFKTISYRFDLYGAFVEQSAKHILRVRGAFGFIIPHTLLSNDSFRELRAYLARNVSLDHVMDFGPGVFVGASNETMLLFFDRTPPSAQTEIVVTRTSPSSFPEFFSQFLAQQLHWALADGTPWLVHVDPMIGDLVAHIRSAGNPMTVYCTANQGLRTGDNAKYLGPRKLSSRWKPAVGGKQVARYGSLPVESYVLYDPGLLDAPRRPEIFQTKEKIVVQEIRNISLPRRIVASLDCQQKYCLQSTNVVNLRENSVLDIRYILGILNSALVNFFFRCSFSGNNHIASNQLLQIPIVNPKIRARHDKMVSLVQRMLDLHQRLQAANTDHERTLLQRRIAATDDEIDRLVYELYNLTNQEIAIIEEH